MNPFLIRGIDHPAVAANDVDALANWYCTAFGYEKWFLAEGPPRRVWMLRAPDGTLLEIMPTDDSVRPTRTTWTPGWSHLALRVSSLDEAVAWLDSLDVVWESNEVAAIGGGRVRTLFDPDGNMVQILERF